LTQAVVSSAMPRITVHDSTLVSSGRGKSPGPIYTTAPTAQFASIVILPFGWPEDRGVIAIRAPRSPREETRTACKSSRFLSLKGNTLFPPELNRDQGHFT